MNNTYKKIAIAAIVLFTLSGLSAAAASAPGKADTFYRGVTTIAVSSTTEYISETTVLSSTTETREIGNGQANNGKNANNSNSQDRTVETVQVLEKEVTTTVYDQHHGTANSNGAYIGSFEVVTETVISDETTTVVGDWGPAYSVASGTK